MLLARADREFVTLGEELELLDAYLDVVRAPISRANAPLDLPRLTEALDELVPAMLFPTLAAALPGEIEIMRLQLRDDRIGIAIRSTSSSSDSAALAECLGRLHNLYDGAERTSVETDESGRTIVEIDLPRHDDESAATSEIYDLATA